MVPHLDNHPTERKQKHIEGLFTYFIFLSHKSISFHLKWVKADKNESSIHIVSSKGAFCTV